MASKYKLLQQLGLSEIAIQIYLYLLDVKKTTILTISREADLKRTTVYTNIKELQEINLVGEVIETGTKYIIPESPSNLIDFVKAKKRKAQEVAKELAKEFNKTKEEAKIRYEHGVDGFKRFAEEVFTAQEKPVRVFLHYKSLNDYASERWIKNFNQRRVVKKIPIKVIISHNEYDVVNSATGVGSNVRQKMQFRALPKGKNFTTSIIVYDNIVHFFAPKKEGYIFIFESPAFADTMRKMFDYMWKDSQEVK